MKNKVLFIALMISFQSAFSDPLENIISESDVVSSHYINLNNESTNYVYIVDYNQKNGYIQNFIDNELKYVKSGVNVRFLPIKTGNKNLCFNKRDDDTYYLADKNCVWIKNFPYLTQADLPLAVFSDGNVVKVAVKMNSINLNEYFNMIESAQQQLVNQKHLEDVKIQKSKDLIIAGYNKKINSVIIFNKYYTDMWYNSYYSFYSKPKEKPFFSISFINLLNLNKKEKLNNSSIKISFEKYKLNELFPHFQSDKYNTNPLGFKPKIKKIITSKPVLIAPVINKEVKLNIINHANDGAVPPLVNVNYKPVNNKSHKRERAKLIKKDSLGNGNSVSYYAAPAKKHIDFSWGKGGKPVFNKPLIITDEDPNIIIKNNIDNNI